VAQVLHDKVHARTDQVLMRRLHLLDRFVSFVAGVPVCATSSKGIHAQPERVHIFGALEVHARGTAAHILRPCYLLSDGACSGGLFARRFGFWRTSTHVLVYRPSEAQQLFLRHLVQLTQLARPKAQSPFFVPSAIGSTGSEP
jgi:hypothetical protein